ncbi:O-antigen ligase family protein [Winogradskyella sp. UBA3174]|uniref:O-antigen ligase family protein n=1 Tax=Winogradskyella sp. UBA3174 TaxID=1947785 RepID=UPI0025E337E2|nr:O-antigen polymerase [Winogradskyella sp. UBA3174]|tara:strand:+ start:72398 stop:73690 length:1293 start_codon:yes stop_codon:yes gene_type:complete
MNKFFNNNQINTALLSLVGLGLCYKVNIGNLLLIIAAVYTLFFTKKSFIRLKSIAIGFPLLFFFITIISALYSKDKNEGIGHLDLMLLMVLVVIPYLSQNLEFKNVKKVVNFFFYSISLGTFILLLLSIAKYVNGQDFSEITFHGFTRLYDQHPVYYSMYIVFALYTQITSYKIKFNNKFIELIPISILVAGLLLCASKAVIVVFTIMFFTRVFLIIKSIRQKVYISISVLAFVILTYSIPFLNERFNSGLTFSSEILSFKPTNDFTNKKLFSYDEKENISDLEIRYIFAKIMLYHFLKDDILIFGYGQGDVQNYTDYYNFSYNLGPRWYEGYNVHNQYIYILITYGLFVLILFLLYICYSFYYAIKHRNHLYIFFLIISSFVFFFEVTLVRNKGIVFFYFFNTLFLISHIYFENSNSRHKRSPKSSRRV